MLFRQYDLGPTVDESYDLQGRRFIESHNAMGWTAFAPGERDFAHGTDYLLEMRDLAEFPFVSANIVDAESGELLFEPYIVKKVAGFRVGIIGVMGEGVELTQSRRDDLGIDLLDPMESIKDALKELDDTADFIILLAHTGMDDAQIIAEKIDGIDVIIAAHLPRGNYYQPTKINHTLITQGFDQGKYLVRLDVHIQSPKRPYDLFVTGSGGIGSIEYQNLKLKLEQLDVVEQDFLAKKAEGEDVDYGLKLVELERKKVEEMISEMEAASEMDNPNFVTPTLIALSDEIPDDEAVLAIGNRYMNRLITIKEKITPEDPGDDDAGADDGGTESDDAGTSSEWDPDANPTYVGIKKCIACHKTIYTFWLTTKHSRAYPTLEEEKRQYEPDCISCHTTGYKKYGGFTDITKGEKYLNVQCEACHGPGSLHVRNPETKMKDLHSEKDCLKCHDEDNDDDFDYQRDLEIIRCPEQD
ncbi:MAG: hypothetical protein JW885_15540 [Deltaproteobacteria bacterium]|nr:hypothetical protein [Candidatus Zymogenaceae bacterium]